MRFHRVLVLYVFLLKAIRSNSACPVFEEEDFTVEILTFNGVQYGSVKEHIRTWFVIWDIARRVSDELGLLSRFHSLMSSLHLDKFPINKFLLDEETLAGFFRDCPYGANMRSLKGER